MATNDTVLPSYVAPRFNGTNVRVTDWLNDVESFILTQGKVKKSDDVAWQLACVGAARTRADLSIPTISVIFNALSSRSETPWLDLKKRFMDQYARDSISPLVLKHRIDTFPVPTLEAKSFHVTCCQISELMHRFLDSLHEQKAMKCKLWQEWYENMLGDKGMIWQIMTLETVLLKAIPKDAQDDFVKEYVRPSDVLEVPESFLQAFRKLPISVNKSVATPVAAVNYTRDDRPTSSQGGGRGRTPVRTEQTPRNANNSYRRQNHTSRDRSRTPDRHPSVRSRITKPQHNTNWTPDRDTCYRCAKTGHYTKDCRSEKYCPFHNIRGHTYHECTSFPEAKRRVHALIKTRKQQNEYRQHDRSDRRSPSRDRDTYRSDQRSPSRGRDTFFINAQPPPSAE